MSQIKQSFAWWCIQNRVEDPKTFFSNLSSLGYAGVELLPLDLWPIAIDAGLEIVTVSAGSLTNGLNRLENHDEIEKEVEKNIKLVEEFGLLNIIVFSGNRKGLDDPIGAENTIKGLTRLAPYARSCGVTLILELLNSKIDHIDYMCDHTNWAVNVINQVNSPHVKILYDIYHMQIMEGDIVRTIHQNGQHFGHIHTAGNPGRQDMDESQELNYKAIFNALKETNYTGYIGHEFIPKVDPYKALQYAYELCRDNVS